MSVPDFIIVGTAKSGTTSLGFHLRNHREVCMPAKEVHYFDDDKHYAKGPHWYRDVLQRGRRPHHRVVGEKTPTYSYKPEVPARIYRTCPGVKLVWIFRHPVDRAYSNYLHALVYGAERMTFEDAVRREAERVKKNVFRGYMDRSRYLVQVQRYLDWFSSDQMHFVLFEELVTAPLETLRGVFDFLGVSREGFVHREEQRNKTVLPRWPLIAWAARRVFGRSLPGQLIRKLGTVGQSPGYPRLSAATRARLAERFQEDNERLGRLICKDLSVWDAD